MGTPVSFITAKKNLIETFYTGRDYHKNSHKLSEKKFVTLTKIDLSDDKMTPRLKRENYTKSTMSTKSSKNSKREFMTVSKGRDEGKEHRCSSEKK